MLSILGHILFYLALVSGVLLTSLGLFGTWVILVASVIYGWVTGFSEITLQVIGILALIALALEGVEFLLAVKLAEKMGASRKASWAAVVGAILGGIWGTAIFPIIGSLIGALVGAFLAATLLELLRGKSPSEVAKAGRGALIGRGGALVVKTIGAIVMVVIILSA
jgi:uncharacterized protein YqgC (DUF456 family)